KLLFEMSKKTLSTASTLMRASGDESPGGRVIVWEPSLGVPAARTRGKVWPPSIDSRMSTAAQLTGGFAVPATSQVTVCVEPAGQTTDVSGEVTVNGPLP